MNLNELYVKLRAEVSSAMDFKDNYVRAGILAAYIKFTGKDDVDRYKDLYQDKKLMLKNLFETETDEIAIRQEIGYLQEAFKGEDFVYYGGMVELGCLMALGALVTLKREKN